MASEAERDGFVGAISSAAAPAVSLWLPFWIGMEVNDIWTARILAFLIPFGAVIVFVILAKVIGYLGYLWATCKITSSNRNAAPALKGE